MKKVCPEVEIIRGLPELSQLDVKGTDILLICDDLGKVAMNSPAFYDIFTKISHHGRVSIFLTLQNIFGKSIHGRTNIINCSHIVLFR
jgi:hypothetical protein